MSWFSFSRLSTPKKTVITKGEEKAFEDEVQKIEVLDEATKKLYKDMKKCIDSMAQLSKLQCRIGQDLAASPLLNTEDDFKEFEEMYASISSVDEFMVQFNENAQRCMIDPMKKFSAIFPSVYSAIRKREQLLQEFRKAHAKMEKYQEKERTGPNIVKFEQAKKALNAARVEYEAEHTQLMEELPQFFDGRIAYFQPCFEALIKSQVNYYTECFHIYAELAAHLKGEEFAVIDDEKYEVILQQKLSDIRALSIVIDD
ncbi:bridging integrator 3-like [Anneissia japonica]|uniref:bridging integrator 3-like n=1 Tax=Anneissia japonica TaxID=1529436 RepID=UPI0014259DA0|nr:bridging integrator 3-like [Anneissia japonica]